MSNSKYPQLLILEEKNDDSYYLVENQEELERIFTELVQERFKTGYYYYKPTDPRETLAVDKRELLDLSAEEVAALPETFRQEAERVRSRHERRLREFQEEQAEYEEAEKLSKLPLEEAVRVTTPRGHHMATVLMQNRQDYEYEGYRLERFQNR